MKVFIVTLCFTVVSFLSYADQLEYVTRQEAMAAAEIIQDVRVVYSYCGCCDNDKPIKLKVEKIIVRATGYEDTYQVYVVYKGTEIPLDLAYVWYNDDLTKSYKTLGEGVGAEHDPCNRIPKK